MDDDKRTAVRADSARFFARIGIEQERKSA